MSSPKIFKSGAVNHKINSISFKAVDLDKNGSIDPSEFDAITNQVNTTSPAWGLFLILIMVVISTGACSFMLRKSTKGVQK